MSLTPSSLGATTQNYIGRSQYAADAYLNGRVDEFRIYDDALNAAEVAALAAPPPLAASIGLASAGEDSHVTEFEPSRKAATSSGEKVPPSGEWSETFVDGLPVVVRNDTGRTGQLFYYDYLALGAGVIADASGNNFVLSTASHLWQRSNGSHPAVKQQFEAPRVQNNQRPDGFAMSHRHAIDTAISELSGDSDRWCRSLQDELLNDLIGRGNCFTAL
jgi:hypothetical protein